MVQLLLCNFSSHTGCFVEPCLPRVPWLSCDVCLQTARKPVVGGTFFLLHLVFVFVSSGEFELLSHALLSVTHLCVFLRQTTG